ncbi:MAG: hypothetical protein AAGD96_16225 [Chloroflexota bacterium]
MKDFEKFDELLNRVEHGSHATEGEFDDYLNIAHSLKDQQPFPSAQARAKSRQLLLSEAKQVKESSKKSRLVNLGSLLAFAVPALLVFAVLATVLRSRVPDNVQVGAPSTEAEEFEGVLAPVQEIDPTVEAPVVEIEPTAIVSGTRITNEGTDAVPISGEVEEADVNDESPAGSDQITPPDSGDSEFDLPQPQLPLPGAGIEPPIDGDERSIITPRPGDGREDGRNPDS